MEKPYYVYQLIDPRDGRVFYAGKGRGKRAWAHEKRVRNGDLLCNPARSLTIGEIVGDGLSVVVSIVERFDREKDALLFEESFIKAGFDVALARQDYQRRRFRGRLGR